MRQGQQAGKIRLKQIRNGVRKLAEASFLRLGRGLILLSSPSGQSVMPARQTWGRGSEYRVRIAPKLINWKDVQFQKSGFPYA